MSITRLKTFIALLLLVLLAASLLAQRPHRTQPPQATYLRFEDAQQVVATLAEILPPALKDKSEEEIKAAWPRWVENYDKEIRARLARGDEDSVINFLLFGTTFTKQPRVTLVHLRQVRGERDFSFASFQNSSDFIPRLIAQRTRDLVLRAAAPAQNDRVNFVRNILAREKRFDLRSEAGRLRASEFLIEVLKRVMEENSGYARVLDAARLQGDATEEFAERSTLFRARGLSLDTSLLPNYAIEETLKEIKQLGLIAPGRVERIAIIGPGLDFTDKQEGYDFYPPQTIQPFAIVDTLARLGLAKRETLRVATLDLSTRVNDHIARAKQRAARGASYVVQLPREEEARWMPGAIAYWERFGNQIGQPTKPASVLNVPGLKMRAVQISPFVLSRISPFDTNIVLQRLELPPSDKFDLIIATNMFVYYDNFDQSLAMMNIQEMLKPGGFMLSNNALLELPFFKVRSAGYTTVTYSDRADDGDHIVWYRRAAD